MISKKREKQIKEIIYDVFFEKVLNNPEYKHPPETWGDEEKETWDFISEIHNDIEVKLDNLFSLWRKK